jgi:hypothetical protein
VVDAGGSRGRDRGDTTHRQTTQQRQSFGPRISPRLQRGRPVLALHCCAMAEPQESCAAAVCASSCFSCWTAVSAPPCATACASGDQSWVLVVVAVAPYVVRCVFGVFTQTPRESKKKTKKKGKKSRQKEEYEGLESTSSVAITQPKLTMARLLVDGSDWDEAAAGASLVPAQCAGRLLAWHIAQPLSVFVVFQATAPQLTCVQWWLGACICCREALHLVSLVLAVLTKPAFLLLDVPASVQQDQPDESTDSDAQYPGFATGRTVLALHTLSPEMFLALVWSHPAAKRIGFAVMLLGFLFNLGGAAALATIGAQGTDQPPPLGLAALCTLAALDALVALHVARDEDCFAGDSDSESESDSSDGEGDEGSRSRKSNAVVTGGVVLLATAVVVGWCIPGSEVLDLKCETHSLTATTPADLPIWQVIAAATVVSFQLHRI